MKQFVNQYFPKQKQPVAGPRETGVEDSSQLNCEKSHQAPKVEILEGLVPPRKQSRFQRRSSDAINRTARKHKCRETDHTQYEKQFSKNKTRDDNSSKVYASSDFAYKTATRSYENTIKLNPNPKTQNGSKQASASLNPSRQARFFDQQV